MEGKTQWNEEVVSEKEVKPLKEIKISDTKEFLLDLAEKKELIIKFYPEKIAGIPKNDSDLVERAVLWTKQFGKKVLEQFEEYHPHLVERAKKQIKKGKKS